MSPTHQLTDATLEAMPTKSDRIRALASAGHPRAEIARRLGVRYQFVRNVLVAQEGRAEAPRRRQASLGEPIRLEVGAEGRVLIPQAVRESLGFKPGSTLWARIEEGELRVCTPQQGLRRARDILRRHVPAGVSLSDELIAERRAEGA